MLEIVPTQVVDHWRDVASSEIVTKDKSSSSALNQFQTIEAYSSCGRTRLVYALDLTAVLHSPRILLSKPRVLFALLHMMSHCLFLFKLWFIVMPRYLVEDTLLMI